MRPRTCQAHLAAYRNRRNGFVAAHGQSQHCGSSAQAQLQLRGALKIHVAGQNGDSGAAAQAPYKTLENLHTNLKAFPHVEFFRIEVRWTAAICRLKELLYYMKLLQAIVRPWRLPMVVHELSLLGIQGMTATRVHGVGVQGGA